MQVAAYELRSGPATLRVARDTDDLAALDTWLAGRVDRVLGLDLETNAVDPWHHGFAARMVQVADVDEAWVVPVWSRCGSFTYGAELSRMLRRHPRFVAHFSEADMRFAMRGLPDSPIRLWEHEPHVVDLQVVLALYDPRTVTTHSKQDRIDPGIPRPKGLKETASRLLGPELAEAEHALHARFRALAPVGSRTKRASIKHGFAHVPDDDPAYLLYAALDPLCAVRLWHLMTPALVERGQGGRLRAALVEQWVMDCATYVGLAVDEPYARWLDGQLRRVVDELAARLAEHGVPPSGQGPAVAQAFDTLGVKPVKVSDSGEPSWDRHALTKLVEEYDDPETWGGDLGVVARPGPAPRESGRAVVAESTAVELARALLDVRRAGKFRSAYIAPMLAACELGDGASHGSVRAIGAVTTRMTAQSTDSAGALQQMPKRDPRIRACYRARRGRVLVSADFRQAEPHVMAALSGDEVMLADLRAGDINSAIATTVYGSAYVPAEGKTAGTASYLMRQAAKFSWLAWCYGARPRKLAALLDRPVTEGEQIVERWCTRYPRFARWQDQCNARTEITLDSGAVVPLWDVAWVDERGEVRRRVDGMGRPVRSRLGPNAATQGGQRDLLAVAMHRAHALGWSWATRMAMHDELVWEVPEWMAPAAVEVLRQCMTVTYRGVTIECDVTVEGRTWLPQPKEFDRAALAAYDKD